MAQELHLSDSIPDCTPNWNESKFVNNPYTDMLKYMISRCKINPYAHPRMAEFINFGIPTQWSSHERTPMECTRSSEWVDWVSTMRRRSQTQVTVWICLHGISVTVKFSMKRKQVASDWGSKKWGISASLVRGSFVSFPLLWQKTIKSIGGKRGLTLVDNSSL